MVPRNRPLGINSIFSFDAKAPLVPNSNTPFPTMEVSSASGGLSEGNMESITPTLPQSQPQVAQKPVLLARAVSWIIRKIVQARCRYTSGLTCSVDAKSNSDILRGRVNNIELQFDSLCYGQLYISGGGRISLQGIDLRMRRFLFQDIQSLRTPYKLSGDLLLTQEDIVRSKFIRDLIQLLVNAVLRNALTPANELVSVVVKRVYINSRRLFAIGEVMPAGVGAAAMPFEVSLGVGVREEGQVVYLRDIQVALNPENAILRTSFGIPLQAPIDIDLGSDCRLESLVLSDSHAWVRFKAIISPVAPFGVAPVQRRAMYYYDLAALLSSVLKLRGGLAVKWTNMM